MELRNFPLNVAEAARALDLAFLPLVVLLKVGVGALSRPSLQLLENIPVIP